MNRHAEKIRAFVITLVVGLAAVIGYELYFDETDHTIACPVMITESK